MAELKPERKWMFIKASTMEEKAGVLVAGGKKPKKPLQPQPGSITKAPQFFTNILQAEPTLDMVTSLRISLGAQPVEWLIDFTEINGIDILLNILSSVEAKPKKNSEDVQMESEILKCLKIIMNIQPGLDKVLKTSLGLRKIAACLSSDNMNTRITILGLLAAVCLCFDTDGHRQVLEAMSHYKLVHRENARFESILKDLKSSDNMEFVTNALTFINAIVNSPADIDVRTYLREEFVKLGLTEVLEKFKREVKEDSDLYIQIEVYEEEAQYDKEEMLERFNELKCDIKSLDSVLSSLLNQVKGSFSI